MSNTKRGNEWGRDSDKEKESGRKESKREVARVADRPKNVAGLRGRFFFFKYWSSKYIKHSRTHISGDKRCNNPDVRMYMFAGRRFCVRNIKPCGILKIVRYDNCTFQYNSGEKVWLKATITNGRKSFCGVRLNYLKLCKCDTSGQRCWETAYWLRLPLGIWVAGGRTNGQFVGLMGGLMGAPMLL